MLKFFNTVSLCTCTKQYKEICDLKETVKTLSNKLAKLEGAQEPLPAPINETTPPVPTKPSEPKSQQAAPPERKLNVVVYGLEETLPILLHKTGCKWMLKMLHQLFQN